MDTKTAYAIVFNELREIPLFRGIFDARHCEAGKEHFMYGIQTVMEVIANQISDATYEQFNEEFVTNLIKSEDKAKGRFTDD